MKVLKFYWIALIFASFACKSNGAEKTDVCGSMTKILEEECCPRGVHFASKSTYSGMSQESSFSAAMLQRVIVWIMVPFTDEHFMFSKNHIEPAVNRALMDANVSLCGSGAVTRGVCYDVFLNDSKCNYDYAVTEAVSIHETNLREQCFSTDGANISELNIFLGLSCDSSASRVGGFATNWNWPAILPGPRSIVFDDKNESCCETMTRPGHSATDLGNFVYSLYNRYDRWNNSYLIYVETSNHGAPITLGYWSDCSTFASGINYVFKNEGWSFTERTKNVPSDNDFLNDDIVSSILEEIKENARVSMWCIGKKAMRIVMNKAHDMNMTSGVDPNNRFAFFYIDLYNANKTYEWTDEDDQPCDDILSEKYCNGSIGDSRGLEALEVISLHHPNTEEYKNFSDDMRNEMGPEVAGSGQFVNPFVAEYYDAIIMLIQGVERFMRDNQSHFSDGSAFSSGLWDRSFQSVDGLVTISETGDRLMNYVIHDLNMETGTFEEAEVYFGANSSWVSFTAIDWPGPDAPKNIPECGAYVCKVAESNSIVGAIVGFVVAVFMILLIGLICAYKRKLDKERKLQRMLWKARPEDITSVVHGRGRRNSVPACLHKNLSPPIIHMLLI